ncbi:hypothetical protein LCGC14_1513280 [marine sediment metagenome]|uniref:Uncharacterized protein n=1 Tax=marine sediment metagenome TaxID=412755 RepID=A0A0F9LGC0_9ZZZZ
MNFFEIIFGGFILIFIVVIILDLLYKLSVKILHKKRH